jgi:hypothetical protein
MTDVRLPAAAEDLVATAQILWPAPATAALVRGARREPGERVVREFAFLPNARRPRLIVPVGVPAAASAALRRYSQALGGVERYGRAALAAAFRTGLADRLLSDRVRISVSGSAAESVEDVLTELLGEPVVVSLGLGNRRANQKPILHVMTPRGETRAFVKVGDNDMARTLVRGEAAALECVAALSLRLVSAPAVLGLIPWNGLELLVLSPLATSPSRGRDEIPYAAITELASAGGVSEGRLVDSLFWKSLRGSALVDPDLADGLGRVLDAVERRHGQDVLRYGNWHGDFTPWNLQWRGDGIQVWDWERFASGVPLGFDALHYRRSLLRGVSGLARHSVHDLARVGVPAELAGATTTLYLVELCVRYLVASQEETGEPLRAQANALLDHLTKEHL